MGTYTFNNNYILTITMAYLDFRREKDITSEKKVLGGVAAFAKNCFTNSIGSNRPSSEAQMPSRQASVSLVATQIQDQQMKHIEQMVAQMQRNNARSEQSTMYHQMMRNQHPTPVTPEPAQEKPAAKPVAKTFPPGHNDKGLRHGLWRLMCDQYYLVGLYTNGDMNGKWTLFNRENGTTKVGEFGEYGKSGETRLSSHIEYAETHWSMMEIHREAMKSSAEEGEVDQDGNRFGIWTLFEDGQWMSGEYKDGKRIGLWTIYADPLITGKFNEKQNFVKHVRKQKPSA